MNENMNTSAKVDNDAVMQSDASLNRENGGERMFTQAQLEQIISDRLQRERKVNESLRTVKQILAGASKRGLVKGSSYSEMASELIKKLSEIDGDEKAQTAADEEDNPCDKGEIPPVTPTETEDGGKNENVSDDGKTEMQAEKEREDDFMATLSFLKASYPERTLDELFEGDLFERFAKGRSGSMREILGDFFDFADAISGKKNEGEHTSTYSSHGSTAFSAQAGRASEVEGLTPRQMEMAKKAGMSYREYAHLLESIPKNKGRTF